MSKNSVPINSRFLADLVLDRESPAYRDLCLMSTDENGLQSDAPAKQLRNELKGVLYELLKGNFAPATEKLAEHVRQPPVITIRQKKERRIAGDFYSTFRPIRIGDREAYLETVHFCGATPAELVYGVLRRSLESGDIQRLALCQRCSTLFYRKSLKGRFCGSVCRWTYFNKAEKRPEDAHDRYVKRVIGKTGNPRIKVARRPRRKSHGN